MPAGQRDGRARWLDPGQQRAWRAWMGVSLRLDYEMNRQLQESSDLSLGDYHVLVALSAAEGQRLQLTVLASTIGWERSRLSHHLSRMAIRGLVERQPSTTDRRATDAVLTAEGRRVVTVAAPGHADLVRRLFFDALDPRQTAALATAMEAVYDRLAEQGSIGRPPD